MNNGQAIPKSVDEYVAACPKSVQPVLQRIRSTIKRAAPGAEETISYQMPAYKLDGYLAYFAAFNTHVGFYPIPSGIERFKKELSRYKQGRGSVQFPLDRPIPYALISKIVKFRAKENLAKSKAKRSQKSASASGRAAAKRETRAAKARRPTRGRTR